MLFTRPRRFGKTLTLSMIRNFFELNYQNPDDTSAPQKMFRGLKISTDREFYAQHMGQYPVISLSLKAAEGISFCDALSMLLIQINEV